MPVVPCPSVSAIRQTFRMKRRSARQHAKNLKGIQRYLPPRLIQKARLAAPLDQGTPVPGNPLWFRRRSLKLKILNLFLRAIGHTAQYLLSWPWTGVRQKGVNRASEMPANCL